MPFPPITFFVQIVSGFIIISMIVRMIASWFQQVSNIERFAIVRFCIAVTEPFIQPIRRYVKPIGSFDLSFLIAMFFIFTAQTLLLQSIAYGW